MHIPIKKSTFTRTDILTRGVEEIIEKKSLAKRLSSGGKLRVKFGIDPTGPDIHLGHTVALWKLRQFQDAGHKAVLIIGDFTATIGDPSEQSKERKMLTKKEVKNNMKTYLQQIAKILDMKKTEIRHNSEWHEKEGLNAALQLARTATLLQLTKRSDFKERIKKGEDITFIELFYPLLQAYDSVKIKADVEIGGTDQKFNLLMGRQIQRKYGQKPQDILTFPLLLGTDGVRKMGKSFDNYIALSDKSHNMFGKIMSIPDSEIVKYFELVTPIPLGEINKIKKEKISGTTARNLKLNLAETITSLYWGKDAAQKAGERFKKVFQEKDVTRAIEEKSIPKSTKNTGPVLTEVLKVSKSEARRLVNQGGVYIDGKRVGDYNQDIPRKPFTLRVGKKRIMKIILK
ncbi:MAG: tyrosine--tRNA ligase [Candidatus Spechtbacterales bacterium]